MGDINQDDELEELERLIESVIEEWEEGADTDADSADQEGLDRLDSMTGEQRYALLSKLQDADVSRRDFMKIVGLGAGGLAFSSAAAGAWGLFQPSESGTSSVDADSVDGVEPPFGLSSIDGSAGTSGQFLQTDGTDVSWAAVAAGSDTQLQYNNGGSLGGASGLTYDDAASEVTASNVIHADGGVEFPDNSAGTDSVIPSSYASSNYVIQNCVKFGTSGSTESTSYTTIPNSDIALDFDRSKDKDGQVYINVLYHVFTGESGADPQQGWARLYRQNAGTAVSGTEVTWTSSSFEIVESGWVDMSSESGTESYQIQLRADGAVPTTYNGTTLLIATPQG